MKNGWRLLKVLTFLFIFGVPNSSPVKRVAAQQPINETLLDLNEVAPPSHRYPGRVTDPNEPIPVIQGWDHLPSAPGTFNPPGSANTCPLTPINTLATGGKPIFLDFLEETPEKEETAKNKS
jgi:hypothetical protein